MTPFLKTKNFAYLLPKETKNVKRVEGSGPSGIIYCCFLLTSCFLSTGPHATEYRALLLLLL